MKKMLHNSASAENSAVKKFIYKFRLCFVAFYIESFAERFTQHAGMLTAIKKGYL